MTFTRFFDWRCIRNVIREAMRSRERERTFIELILETAKWWSGMLQLSDLSSKRF